MHLRYLTYIILIFMAVLISRVTSAQEKRLKRADAIYEAGEYHRAAEAYKSVLDKLSTSEERVSVYFKMGNAYYLSGSYRLARTYLHRVIRYDKSNREAYLKLGEVYRLSDKYEDALEVYNEYQNLNGKDSVFQKKIEETKMAQEWKDIKTRFKVKEARDFNTRADDFTTSVVEKDGYDHVFFASTRKGVTGKDKSDITGDRFSDIFVSKKNRKGEWDEPQLLDSLNSPYDEGAPCLLESGSQMYFTSCQVEKNKKKGCQIYKISKTGTEWMNPERVSIVPDTVSVGHPSLTPDQNRMYFASRKQGGYGGADIWYVEKENGDWGKPINAGPEINSPYDELFPYVLDDSTLFFSSEQYPSMGGLDLFKAKKISRYRWKVENMKPPFSSPGNDFGIYYYKNADKGYFTSDRDGSKGQDIYFFEKPPLKFALEGYVTDKDTEAVIDSAVVHLIGSDGTMFTDTTDAETGYFYFNLKPNTEYVYVVHEEGYFNGKARLTTDTLYYDHTFVHHVKLESYQKTFEIPNIEFEFGSFALTDKAKHSLDSVVELLNNNPNLVIELSAHTDMIGTDEDNMELSKKRADAVADYLISKGIAPGRLQTRGFGESQPIVIDEQHNEYDWLEEGDVLTPEFIEQLSEEQQKIANQMNRRTEFRVIQNDYIPSLD
ncbi:MAG: OmpA family protein [Bacteroidales bacterium]